MKIVTPILIVIILTLGIFSISSHAPKIGLKVHENGYLNYQANYQLLLIGFAVLSMLSSYFLNPSSFKAIFSVGNLSAIGEELKIFGIKKGDSWMKTGISLSVVISIATLTFMYFQLRDKSIDFERLNSGFIWILIFALTNSFSEEIIYRVGINGPLYNLLSPNKLFLLSAILFGIAHYQGMPNGLIGVAMAGLLGYVLSKSIFETQGIFWAWFIHFLQDVWIIGALFLLKD